LRSEFVMGVQCHYCMDEHSDQQKERFRMRQRQIELAESRGERHVGMDPQIVKQRQEVARQARTVHKEQQRQLEAAKAKRA